METAWIVFNNDAGALPIHHLTMEAAWVMFNKILVLFHTQLPLQHLSLICKVCDQTICLHLKIFTTVCSNSGGLEDAAPNYTI
jgi:uncharacterized membrane protein YpjA